MKKLIAIEGMSCGHCVMLVRSALESLPGVTNAEVDLIKKSAMVEGEALENRAMIAAVAQAGYRVVAIRP